MLLHNDLYKRQLYLTPKTCRRKSMKSFKVLSSHRRKCNFQYFKSKEKPPSVQQQQHSRRLFLQNQETCNFTTISNGNSYKATTHQQKEMQDNQQAKQRQHCENYSLRLGLRKRRLRRKRKRKSFEKLTTPLAVQRQVTLPIASSKKSTDVDIVTNNKSLQTNEAIERSPLQQYQGDHYHHHRQKQYSYHGLHHQDLQLQYQQRQQQERQWHLQRQHQQQQQQTETNLALNLRQRLNNSITKFNLITVHLLTAITVFYANISTIMSTTTEHIRSVAIAATTLPNQLIQQLLNILQPPLQLWRQLSYCHCLTKCTRCCSSPYRKLSMTIRGLNKYSWILLLMYLNLSAKVCLAGYNEKRLLHDLLDTYNTLERPVLNESDPLQLSFGLTLMQIIDVDEKNQLLVTNVWLKLEWNDMNLRWNTSDYGGIKDLRIPPHRIWKPDVLMYNSADEGFDGTYQTNVVVRNNGSCLYVPPGIFKSTCKIDITWFPFDDQRCEMKFGSWTYDGFQLDLQLQDETGGDISSYVLNGEWELLGVPGKRNEIYYNCCPEPYIDITFTIIIRRRTLYYFFNLIIPCVLIASMALLGFTLPPDSGEKLSLGVTILLSLTVFLNMVAETMPATSDAVPLLGTYFNCIMFMVASSVVSTILILNYHHRNADTHEMSEWIRVVFLCWLPWILRMHRPGRPIILDFSSTPCSDTSSERKHQILSEVELKERSSKSLLANVLDIDDDFRNCRPMTPGGTLPHNPAFYRTVYGQGDDGSIGPIGSTRMPDAVTHHSCIKSSTEYELSLILKEIRFITDQVIE
ncbi:neuronal acetylcholine receptor subunit alpha-7-like isoform 2-T2 [Glossina fuscipes fuscipes]